MGFLPKKMLTKSKFEAQDMAKDKKMGIKEGSKKDNKLDSKKKKVR
jgi:hypothetical protein